MTSTNLDSEECKGVNGAGFAEGDCVPKTTPRILTPAVSGETSAT
jgi:hypothetical protein